MMAVGNSSNISVSTKGLKHCEKIYHLVSKITQWHPSTVKVHRFKQKEKEDTWKK
jgi:hypothetical protein